MQTPYIPSRDADFQNWIVNFATLIAAAPATYGLVAGDATAISAAQAAWSAAYIAATDPSTRTSATIAAKQEQRIAATFTCRPYAVTISRNPAVSNENKVAVGVNLTNASRTPIPAPTSQPALTLVGTQPGVTVLQARDALTPLSKRKPFGAIGVEISQVTGDAPVAVPDTAQYLTTITKTPLRLPHSGVTLGKVRTFFARYITKSGPQGVAQKGPWSAPISVVLG